MAWLPGPVAEVARVPTPLCALRRGHRVRWHARRRPVVASRWQGVAGELMGTTGRAPGKEGAGGAHRGGGVTTGRRGGSVRRCAVGSLPEGGLAVTQTSS
jgi:hypothetical protein